MHRDFHLRRLGRQARGTVLLLTALASCMVTPNQMLADNPTLPAKGLLLPGEMRRRSGRATFDSVTLAVMRQGSVGLPFQAGQSSTDSAGNSAVWQEVTLTEKGGLPDGTRGRYLLLRVKSNESSVRVLHAPGTSVVYVNGEARIGDVYGHGYVYLPVLLRRGINEILMKISPRGRFRVELKEPARRVYLETSDATLPDLVVGRPVGDWAAVIVVNASPRRVKGLEIACQGEGVEKTVTTVPDLAPLTIHKVPFRIKGPIVREGEEPVIHLSLRTDSAKEAELNSRTTSPEKGTTDDQLTDNGSVQLTLRVRKSTDAVKRTFRSTIDDSVQYYGLRQADGSASDPSRAGIVLSCHGAGVTGIGQSSSYPTKTWVHLVARTNRRKFGFDWEDFGRADAMEVLSLAKRSLPHDPSRIYLTGHSMGGHGAWHLGTTFPDQFAAIGPSAGWISYARYGRPGRAGEDKTPMEKLIDRGSKAGDALELVDNVRHQGVYILHGQDDDNVPVSQARTMAETLGKFHHDWQIHEEPGKRHWWSNDLGDGGATCMDWPAMYDMFARHALPPVGSTRDVEFVTVNPGISSHCYWLGIHEQHRAHAVSRAHIMIWPNKGRFRGTTDNVALLRLDPTPLRSAGPLSVELDGQVIEEITRPEVGRQLWLQHEEGRWAVIDRPSLDRKGPHRYGAPKDELRHRFLFIVGTRGSADDARWTAAKARFDAETFWYRGNASVDVITDTEFRANDDPSRTVVLYGNADSNSAWHSLLADSPIQVRNGSISVGEKRLEGDGLATLFVRPRPSSDQASVVAVAAAGPLGMRRCQTVSLFVPFVHYPDYIVWRTPETASTKATVAAAGYFGMDWSLDQGESVWEDAPTE